MLKWTEIRLKRVFHLPMSHGAQDGGSEPRSYRRRRVEPYDIQGGTRAPEDPINLVAWATRLVPGGPGLRWPRVHP